MKYSLVRKKGYQWTICSIHDSDGKNIKGAKTTDKSVVVANKVYMQGQFPDEVYAIIELEK